MVKLRCRLCKAIKDHEIIPEFSLTLPPHLAVVECYGCGVLGVSMIENRGIDDGLSESMA